MRTSEMRKFILKVLLFFVVIAMVDRGFGLAMSNVLKGTQKGDWGRNNFIFNEVKSDVIILGSSRAIHHYDPQIISDSLSMSCYNCGEDGNGIILSYGRLMMVKERHQPKIIIQDVSTSFDLFKNDNHKYLGWLKKELYNSWRNGLIDMDEIKPSRDTTIYLRILKFFKDRGFKQINYHTLSNDDYVINLDEQTVINKNTNEKIDLKSFIKTLKG